jgi:hypothetical protein
LTFQSTYEAIEGFGWVPAGCRARLMTWRTVESWNWCALRAGGAPRRSAPRGCTDRPLLSRHPHGARDKALVLTGFHYALRPQDPAGLLTGDITLHPRGLVIAVLTRKTSTRNATRSSPMRRTGGLPRYRPGQTPS